MMMDVGNIFIHENRKRESWFTEYVFAPVKQALWFDKWIVQKFSFCVYFSVFLVS